ncbi:MAG: ROK family protein [Propionicimonas sp.]|uniref:ROK family protein n=1 Tax=Propionicimonas sp. TaxID=1955623 RepID=UPI003D13D925
MTRLPVRGPVLGIDIGGTKTHGILLDEARHTLAETVVPTSHGTHGVVASALAVADGCLRSAGLDRAGLTGVGVGIPGQVDPDAGVVRTAVNLGIERLDLGALLAAELGVPVAVDNDVKAAARGAAAHLGVADLTYLNVGTGVAAATLVGGRLLRGSGNLAGEIGHIPVDPSADRCACGQRGCLEVLVGGGRIAARLAPFSARFALPTLLAAADAGDADARIEVDRISSGMATAIQLVVLTQGSPLVALGGGVVHTAEGLVERVRRVLAGRASESPFLASLALPDRLAALPSDLPLAALGAALVGRSGLADVALSTP